MRLSLSQICYLCAESSSNIALTNIKSDNGKQENLEMLLSRYISAHICLPKDDKLCICDTCKTRLKSWHSFIEICKIAQEKLEKEKDICVDESPLKKGIRNTHATSIASTSGSSIRMKKSSNYCIARWCNTGNYRGVTLFRLPRDKDRALVWLSKAERSDLKNSLTSTRSPFYLCAKHFTSDMFTNKSRNQLIRKAIPTVFPRAAYADKIALNVAASQILPTHLQGVLLKNILPKSNHPLNISSTQLGNILEGDEPMKMKQQKTKNTQGPIILQLLPQVMQEEPFFTYQNSNEVIEVDSSELPEISNSTNFIHVANAEPLLSLPQGSVARASSKDESSSCSATALDGYDKQEKVKTIPVPWDVLQVETLQHDKAPCVIDQESETKVLITSDTVDTKSELSCSYKEQQKQTLEEVEASSIINASASLTDDKILESSESKDLNRKCFPISEKFISSSSAENIDVPSEFLNPVEFYQSSVGSQDFLLTHVLEKVDNVSLDSSKQCFPLQSDSSGHSSESGLIAVSMDHNNLISDTTNTNCNLELLNLKVEDMQEPDNTPHIINMETLDVDELMDFDQYFEPQ